MNNTIGYLNKISEIIEKPYFYEMENYGISDEDEMKYILRKVYNKDIHIYTQRPFIERRRVIYDGCFMNPENEIYGEYDTNTSKVWYDYTYEVNNNTLTVSFQENTGYYFKRMFDLKRREVYFEDNGDGDIWWWKREYDKWDNLIHYENSNGTIEKYEFNKWGDQIYYCNVHYWWRREHTIWGPVSFESSHEGKEKIKEFLVVRFFIFLGNLFKKMGK